MSLCKIELDWDNFRQNLLFFKRLLGSNQEIMPVIKANAYGHGLKEAIHVINSEKIQKIAVGSMQEALEAKKDGFLGQIISLLGLYEAEDLNIFASHEQIIPLVHNFETLTKALAHPSQTKLKIALKFNSGMGRLGFEFEDLAELMNVLTKQTKLEPYILLTHFSSADTVEEEEYTQAQLASFEQAAFYVKNYYPQIKLSKGNTALTLNHTAQSGDILRPGIGLYGGNPFGQNAFSSKAQGLKPVMSAYTKIMNIRNIVKGTSIGYGRSYISSSPRKIAVLGIGYADGYSRGLSKGGKTFQNTKAGVIINDKFAPIIANVAMQMICADVTDIDCKYDDRAYLLGSAKDAKNSIDLHSLAAWWGTISYEVTCVLGQLNNRA